MAEEAQYASEAGSNKRKYEEPTSPSPVSRRPTGFSAPISSLSPPDGSAAGAGAPPPSYNNVPPPMDDFQLAKQRAQEIAARLINNSDPKKPRVDNGGGAAAFESREPQKPMGSTFLPPASNSYGYPGPSKKIEIPNGRVGVIIGKGGETIRYLQLQSGAKIQVTRDMDADPNSQTRGVELMGTPEQIAKAEQLIQDVLSEADSGGSGIISRRLTGQQSGAEQFVMKVPNNKVGLVIGKGGETIKNMQASTGARIQVIPLHLPPGDTSTERTVQIDGTSDQIEHAKQLVNEVISENRVRNPAMTGAYPQQGYQARPPTSWAPPGGQMQQPGYGYMQPGTYPGPSPQYSMPQPQYPGYPPQPTSAGYGTGWDQSNPNQQTAPGGGYDYYSQVPPQQQQPTPGGPGAAPTDSSSAYGYNQQPSSGYSQGQSYSQDGYSGYHPPAPQSGYPNPVPGYDHQQGYNSTTGYSNTSNPAADGNTPSYGTQSDTSQAPPNQSAGSQPGYHASQPGYGIPTSQGGYGTQPPAYGNNYGQPPSQKPPTSQPAYGQPQQSPTAQGGYAQPTQVYPHSQPDSGSQHAPSTGYGAPASQPGYGPPPYGAPQMTQSGVPYNSGYGGSGYSQASAYSTDGSAGGGARASYDTAPTSQSSQPTGSAKTSPQS
ncbi:PREDICTED: far upstream element-binding protein 1-like isoform X1 [Ipomoea nil]|uniref:far upstream element-binding protein 1-like isoform X1 n=1 Tax=Ipomoea nil TaxID=35883 RepID=UPI000900E708|nr:PREDICTED: far upstream element-binding protein 1-like isoform X1 [Ipomoea nil]